jgi:NitT/TauT family transport system substrate-binding protein
MHRRFRKRPGIHATSLLFLLCFSLVSCHTRESKTPVKGAFRIGMVTFAGYAPLYLAQQEGYFGNLDVQLIRIEDIPSIRAAMARKDLDAYLATPDIALDTNTAPPGKAVWAIDESAGGDGVVVAGSVRGIESLKGKKVAAEPGLPPYFVMLYLLDKAGLSKSDVAVQDMSTQDAAAAFASKAVDAAAIYEPYLSTAVKQRPGSRVAISSKQAPDLVVDLIFVRNDLIDFRRADIDTIISGWRKALAFLRAHPDEAYPIMAKAFNLSVNDFKDSSGGVVWLDLADNQRLLGTDASPGVLYKNFAVVRDVLKHNRPEVFMSQPENYLDRSFVRSLPQ